MNQKMIPESLYLALVKENELLKKEVYRLKQLVEGDKDSEKAESLDKPKPPESLW
jgi:hypothetical protein